MKDQQPNKELFLEIYKLIKGKDSKKIEKTKPEEISQQLFGVKSKEKGLVFRIIAKCAAQAESFEEFFESIISQEIPAIKLNNEELSVLKGGAGSGLATPLFRFLSKTSVKMDDIFYGTIDVMKAGGVRQPVDFAAKIADDAVHIWSDTAQGSKLALGNVYGKAQSTVGGFLSTLGKISGSW